MVPSRTELFKKLQQSFDLIVIGGGITGAGIFLEATRLGLKTALLEQHDFASGTSSRSSKLVHGGLRYLQQGNFKLIYESVREREWMLRELPGLVDPLPFLFPLYVGKPPQRWLLKLGLMAYDFFAGKQYHHYLEPDHVHLRVPPLTETGNRGGYYYLDAETDDARLTWRVIEQGIFQGGIALNYTKVSKIERNEIGTVQGVCIEDTLSKHSQQLQAPTVINATGFLANQFTASQSHFRLRPLRGSHAILPSWKVPLSHAIAAAHPQDGRMVFVIPWQGITMVGTTDLDHTQNLAEEPYCTEAECAYLLTHLQYLFPSSDIEAEDILNTFAGVRSIVSSGKKHPSTESRDHIILENQGVITVTGGKLTTWRLIAKAVLKKVLKHPIKIPTDTHYFPKVAETLLSDVSLPALIKRKLLGRYGPQAEKLLALRLEQQSEQLIPGTQTLWAELDWIVEHELIVHLDDLLLRRTRLGLLLPEGGKSLLPQIGKIITPLLGWNSSKWEEETTRYNFLWQKIYQPRILSRK